MLGLRDTDQHNADVVGLRSELAHLWKLALPVMVVQVGLMAMGVVDTIVAGHIPNGDGALAAVALGALHSFACVLVPFGILTALDPLIAQAYGAKDHAAVDVEFRRGLLLALLLSVPAALAMLPGETLFALADQPEEIIPRAALFARWNMLGTVPILLFAVVRTLLQATHRLRHVVAAVIIANVANLVLNLVFVLGWGGMESLGVAGSALSTVISRWIMLLSLLGLAWGDLAPHFVHLRPRFREDLSGMRRILGLGLPIAGQFLLEWGAFGIAALLMGRMGQVPVEGHQVAVNLASFSFMFPLGISIAAGVRVGNAIGAGDMPAARRAAFASLVSGIGVMCCFALLFLIFPGEFAALYTDQPASAAVAATLIPLAGIFQIFDGTQVVSIGILRGVGDTRTPFIMNILGFWCLGVPAGMWLAFSKDLGPAGLWWGLVLGLASVAILLLTRARRALNTHVTRIGSNAQ